MLPAKGVTVCDFYEDVLAGPKSAIADCKQYLAGWIVEYWAAAKGGNRTGTLALGKKSFGCWHAQVDCTISPLIINV
jgi:hypothetical protein